MDKQLIWKLHFKLLIWGQIFLEIVNPLLTVPVSTPRNFPLSQKIRFNAVHFEDYFMEAGQYNGSPVTPRGIPVIKLFSTIIHEVLHGIGVNNISSSNYDIGWQSFLETPADVWYTGGALEESAALREYKIITGNGSLDRIPVENDFGGGTQSVHWEEGIQGNYDDYYSEYRYFDSTFYPSLEDEIMTGFLDGNEYFSRMTVGYLDDFGYNVNYNSEYVIQTYPPSLVQGAGARPISSQTARKTRTQQSLASKRSRPSCGFSSMHMCQLTCTRRSKPEAEPEPDA